MRTDISTVSLTNMNAVSTGEGWLFLMTLTTQDDTFRVVNNNTSVSSGGQLYEAYAFNVTLSNDDGDSLPQFKVIIDNVDFRFIEAIRKYAEPPQVMLQLVPISNVDAPEIVTPWLSMRDIGFDAFQITGTLMAGDALNQRATKERYTPQTTPGLF